MPWRGLRQGFGSFGGPVGFLVQCYLGKLELTRWFDFPLESILATAPGASYNTIYFKNGQK